MSTTTTQAASGTTGSGGVQNTRTRGNGTGMAADFDTFLTLLTVQLRNQDPTNAMDVNQMTEQLVSFTGVEQQIQMNRQLQDLLGLQQGAQLTSAAGLIGRRMEVQSDRLVLQSGEAALRLPAAGEARSGVLRITDAAGRVVREASLPLGQQPTTWRWDGRDAAGRAMPDGAYAFTLEGRDALGGAAAVQASVLARATGAERSGNGVALRFGNLSLGLDRLRGMEP